MPTEDTRVRIAQCLCPQRHCIAALAFEPSTVSNEQAIESLQAFVARLDPWCGICRSVRLHIEIGQTRFATMEEAAEPLRQLQAENMLARLILTATSERN